MRGKVVHLKAHALSLKPGAKGDMLTIGGAAVAEDNGIEDLDFEAPASVIGDLAIGGTRIA